MVRAAFAHAIMISGTGLGNPLKKLFGISGVKQFLVNARTVCAAPVLFFCFLV